MGASCPPSSYVYARLGEEATIRKGTWEEGPARLVDVCWHAAHAGHARRGVLRSNSSQPTSSACHLGTENLNPAQRVAALSSRPLRRGPICYDIRRGSRTPQQHTSQPSRRSVPEGLSQLHRTICTAGQCASVCCWPGTREAVPPGKCLTPNAFSDAHKLHSPDYDHHQHARMPATPPPPRGVARPFCAAHPGVYASFGVTL